MIEKLKGPSNPAGSNVFSALRYFALVQMPSNGAFPSSAPYRANITGALKKGINELEIEVTNTWANALAGADEGKAPFDGIWSVAASPCHQKK